MSYKLTLVLGDNIEVFRGVLVVFQHLSENNAVVVVAQVSTVNQVDFIAKLYHKTALLIHVR